MKIEFKYLKDHMTVCVHVYQYIFRIKVSFISNCKIGEHSLIAPLFIINEEGAGEDERNIRISSLSLISLCTVFS